MTFFFSNVESRFYLRELQRLLGESMGSLQRNLALLEEEGILQSERVGPLKYFSLNKNFRYFEELKSILLKESRKEKLEKNLRKILKNLKERYRPEKIILFGSFGSGYVQESSDLDLFVIKKNVPQRYWDRVKELAPFFKDSEVGVDFVIWTPEELKQEEDNMFLKEEILKKGRVVYDRAV